ncbi:MAG TPA: hypothetical protein VKT78_07160 [Fimbriimonadaceae bacterium]|nr:hypothetical protein [Fimbriimonadaceae bacterium]
MDAERIAVLGAGSVRCMPAVAGAFAAYFGERPLEVHLFDGDEERLDLFDRFCRVLFTFNRAGHSLAATLDPLEAMEGATRMVLCFDQHCAVRYFRAVRKGGVATGQGVRLVDQLIEVLAPSISDRVEVLSLLGSAHRIPLPHYRRLEWPPEPTAAEAASTPHQILRFLNGEEYPHELLNLATDSPVRAWLEDPSSAPAVLGQREN